MSKVAFYAPLKSPNHATPSGDREIARSMTLALQKAGFTPSLVSELRSFEKAGDRSAQQALIAKADRDIPKIIVKGRAEGWAAWVTYHNYYKAPDLLGPTVADALNIPYVQIESTRARKRLEGPWALFAKIAEEAAHRADAIFYFTQRDSIALKDYAPKSQRLIHLHPFLPWSDLPAPSTRAGGILTAAMMRPGDKLDSYRLIAKSLMKTQADWTLDIAGDGAARPEVEAFMAPFGDRVRFLGLLDADGMSRAYQNASLLFWPGVNEAIGMIYLEAQAHGVPVLAQHRPGLIDVLDPRGTYPAPKDGPKALALELELLLNTPPQPGPIRQHIMDHHLLNAAARTLGDGIRSVIEGSA